VEKECKSEHGIKLSSRNFTRFGFDFNPVVSISAGVFILAFSLYALFNLDHAFAVSEMVRDTIIAYFDWVFILSSNFLVLVCLYLALSRLGAVRIGGVNCKKEFSDFAWYSMLISAGMGIGLMFWAVGEPLTHYVDTPPIFQHPEASLAAMATTYFHWGLHPWGVYALMALALAFFAYNRDMPLSLRSVFYFLFKDRVYGTVGDLIDAFAVLSVLFGLAASLGMGVMQINSGLNFLLGLGINTGYQVILIVMITLVAIISIMMGIHRGIKNLAMLNMRLAFIFMMAVFLLGPSLYIVRLFSTSLGVYFNSLIEHASFISGAGEGWQGTWTIPFLAWWIAWSPFVGMFIARISMGRTVRELILGVLIVPSLLSFFWLSVFGGNAIRLDQAHNGQLFGVVEDNLPVALFELVSLLNIPMYGDYFRILIYTVATALVIIYFITSSDSGSLVVDKISSGGKVNTPAVQRVFWACIEGLLAATLLLIGGEKAIDVLRTAVTTAGLPLALILTAMSFSLIRGIGMAHTKQMKIKDTQKFKRIIQEHFSDA